MCVPSVVMWSAVWTCKYPGAHRKLLRRLSHVARTQQNLFLVLSCSRLRHPRIFRGAGSDCCADVTAAAARLRRRGKFLHPRLCIEGNTHQHTADPTCATASLTVPFAPVLQPCATGVVYLRLSFVYTPRYLWARSRFCACPGSLDATTHSYA